MGVLRAWLNSWRDQEQEQNIMEQPIEIFRNSKILSDEELKEYYQSVFNCCDANKDGLVSIFELKNFLETQEHIDIPDNVLECLYNKFDTNKDRQLDFEEFLEMINDRTFKETFRNIANRVLRFIIVPQMNRKTLKLRRTVTVTGSYESEVKCNKNIVGMLIISIIQVIFFYTNRALCPTYQIEAALVFTPFKRQEIYRYVTYIFLHSDQMHLYGNVIVQIIIGIPLEMVHSWRVLVVYIVGAIGGCLTHSVLDRFTPHNNGLETISTLVGASGAVFSIITAHIASVIMNWREMTHPAVHLLIFGVVIAIDVVYNLFKLTPEDPISYVTHAGGAVVGLLFGVNILRNLRVKKIEKIIWFGCLITLSALFAVFITLDAVMDDPEMEINTFQEQEPVECP
ncbi:rhomboid-related protein 1-like isoform X1 [Diabrotica undecimpunctata]|uniref:rhomboid-related protein 1-like isoform X1 n=1 Tax=Diabrotica undecimpunctata TaxID=50387 RepID=UPI003B63C58B